MSKQEAGALKGDEDDWECVWKQSWIQTHFPTKVSIFTKSMQKG